MIVAAIGLTSLIAQSVSHRPALVKGNIEVPHERKTNWNDHSLFADTIYQDWANKNLDPAGGKVNNPRIWLAKLLLKKDVDDVNKIILKTIPWGVSGSSWAMNKNGDYDFTLAVLTPILYLFGDKPDILYPETSQHLLDVLLIEEGGKFRYKAPKTMDIVDETENHLLMTEGSRYLKNRWKQLHGNKDSIYDNLANGMEDKLSALLIQMTNAGMYEFNSLPYCGYTITGLLNLEAFASEKIRNETRDVLDYMNWTYALGSYQFKHFAPMRRRYDKVGFQELTTDYHSVFMKAWMGYSPEGNTDHNIHGADAHAIMGSCMPYRPADKVVELLKNKGEGYFVKIGHGEKTCPEIYSAGKNYLISSGGSNQGTVTEIVARPTILFLNDNASNVSQTFHVAGPGTDFMKWNNTGVYQNFACAAGPIFIPEGYLPVAENNIWKIFQCPAKVFVAVHSADEIGIMIVAENIDPKQFAKKLLEANPDPKKLEKQFQFPGGVKINYDVNASKDKWVIESVDDKPADRNFWKWALIEGDLKTTSIK